jgi:hypothetical protein
MGRAITMAWRRVMSAREHASGALPPCPSEKTAVPIDSACGTTARRASEWLNVGAALIDDSRRLTAFARPPSVSLRAGAPAAGSVLGPAAFF